MTAAPQIGFGLPASPSWMKPLVPASLVAAKPAIGADPPSPRDMPLGQKLALLIVRQQKSVDGLAARVIEAMRAMGFPEPGGDDWAALRQANYVIRREGVLQLTPSGMSKTQAICLELARQYGIHFIWHGRANGNMGPFVRCTCGWNTYSANQATAHLTLSRYAAQHLRQVREATLPAAYRLPQFTAEAIGES